MKYLYLRISLSIGPFLKEELVLLILKYLRFNTLYISYPFRLIYKAMTDLSIIHFPAPIGI